MSYRYNYNSRYFQRHFKIFSGTPYCLNTWKNTSYYKINVIVIFIHKVAKIWTTGESKRQRTLGASWRAIVENQSTILFGVKTYQSKLPRNFRYNLNLSIIFTSKWLKKKKFCIILFLIKSFVISECRRLMHKTNIGKTSSCPDHSFSRSCPLSRLFS